MEINEHEKVVEHYIRMEQYVTALEYMKNSKVSEEIFYKFSPTLIYFQPYKTIQAWESFNSLDTRKLIPSLMRYNPKANPPEYKYVIALTLLFFFF